MGRYYSGDIEGKFWFAVQNSDDATYFGGSHDYVDGEGEVVEGEEMNEAVQIFHSFTLEDLPNVHHKIQECISLLGDNYEKVQEFFEKHSSYNNEMLSQFLGISLVRTEHVLEWYARVTLGLKIEDCISQKGECNFEAEL